MPVAVRRAGMGSLTPMRTAAETGEVRPGTRFIQKDQPGRIKARLLFPPAATRPCEVGTVLLAGAECLFLYVSPIFPNTTLIACKEHLSPVACRSSFKVRSFLFASNARI